MPDHLIPRGKDGNTRLDCYRHLGNSQGCQSAEVRWAQDAPGRQNNLAGFYILTHLDQVIAWGNCAQDFNFSRTCYLSVFQHYYRVCTFWKHPSGMDQSTCACLQAESRRLSHWDFAIQGQVSRQTFTGAVGIPCMYSVPIYRRAVEGGQGIWSGDILGGDAA